MPKIQQPFQIPYRITHARLDSKMNLTQELVGEVMIHGYAYERACAISGDVRYDADIDFIRLKDADLKPFLEALCPEVLQKITEHCIRQVPLLLNDGQSARQSKEASLNAKLQQIIDAVYEAKGTDPFTISYDPIVVRLSSALYHLVEVHGLCVTSGRGLVVMYGDGNGHLLEGNQENADKMIDAIYKRLATIFHFPNNIKAA